MQNYAKRRDQSHASDVMEFHRKNLVIFMNRFGQLTAHFQTPSSSLINHEIFLAVEAASTVALDDWGKAQARGGTQEMGFAEFFSLFEQMRTGAISLSKGAFDCIEALQGGLKE